MTETGPPTLRVRVRSTDVVLTADREWVLGRGGGADVRIEDDLVSRRHAVLCWTGTHWLLVDAGSRNGLWQGDRQVTRLPIGGTGLEVRVGGVEGPVLQLHPAGDRHEIRLGGQQIGRGRGNDIELSDLLVSRRHAMLESADGGLVLRDLGSSNGTYVNGRRIELQQLAAGDLVTIGPHQLRYDGARLIGSTDDGDVGFGASGVTVSLGNGQVLVHDVSFDLPARTLLGVVGPSGAGKSTLLGALTGLRPDDASRVAYAGSVAYAGRDLYRNYDELRQRIGFVPQQDILHQTLTVRQALGYGARLRFPDDTTEAERSERILAVAGELGLGDRLDIRIDRLSGGERKRASTAMELLTRPSLLFLDEPTSGLDTDLDREVMQLLRGLADDGRTVVVVTHNLEHLGLCDVVLLLARGGHVAYLGPADGALAHFDARSWADVFARLKARPGQEWAALFAGRDDRDRRSGPAAPTSDSGPLPALTSGRRQRPGTQFATLCRRQLAVTASDRTLLTILAVLPCVLAAIARAVPGEHGLALLAGNGDARQLLLVLIVGASLTGSAGAVRELVKERAVYRRERAVGLSAVAYLASKVVVLGAVAAAQGVALTVLALAGRPGAAAPVVLPDAGLEIALAVAAVTAVSAVFGLLISAAVRDESQAMPLLVLISMAQLVLCGALVPVVGRPLLEQLSWLLPARWGFAAVAATVDLNAMNPQDPHPDPLWTHGTPVWIGDLTALTVLGLVAVALTARLLSRLDPTARR